MSTEGYWWCPRCLMEVDASCVTYSEQHDPCGHPVAWIELVDDADPIRQAVKAERDQCCKEACELCAIGIPVEQRDGTWKHQAMKWSGKLHWFHCGASAIRERAAKEKDNES